MSKTNQKVCYQALMIQRRTPTRVPFVWDRRRLEDGKVRPSGAPFRLALGQAAENEKKDVDRARAGAASYCSRSRRTCRVWRIELVSTTLSQPWCPFLQRKHFLIDFPHTINHREALHPTAVLEWTLG